MTTFIEPLPGLLDDPLLHLPDLPPRTDVRIAPLRDPFPSRAFRVPSPLEPNAPDDSQPQGGVKLGSRKDASDQHPGTPKITPADVIFDRDAKNHNLAISALVGSSSAAHPTRALPPSFVNLAAVENRPSQPWLPDYARSKRLKSDQEFQCDYYLQLPKPQQKEVSQPVPLLPTIVNGIHEPPPSAALLPPMELEEVDAMLASISEPDTLPLPPEKMLNPAEPHHQDAVNQGQFKPSSSGGALGLAKYHFVTSTNKPARTWRKWSDEESRHLLTGVVQHGAGRWKQICADPELKFRDRRPTDLKDRFRIITSTATKEKEKDNRVVNLHSDSGLTSSSGCPQSNTTAARHPSDSTNANPATLPDLSTENHNSTDANPATFPDLSTDNHNSTDANPASLPDLSTESHNSTDANPPIFPDLSTDNHNSTDANPASLPDVSTDNHSSADANPASFPDLSTDNHNSTNLDNSNGLSNSLRSDLLIDLALSKSRANQRVRKHWTEAEHDSLMKGFAKHGYQWTTIRNDIELNLSHRKATDLRDKFRSLFPQQYMDAESAPPRRQSVGTGRPVGAPRKYPDVSLPKKSSSESSASGSSCGKGRFTIAGGNKRNSTTAAGPFSTSRRTTKQPTPRAPPTRTTTAAGGGLSPPTRTITAAGGGLSTPSRTLTAAGGGLSPPTRTITAAGGGLSPPGGGLSPIGAGASCRPDEGSRDNVDSLSEALMPQQYHHHNADSGYSAAGAVSAGSNVPTLPSLALGDIDDWDWDDNKLAPLLDWEEEFDL